MIVELSIRNFAIVEELRLQFDKGFNVLTGETGAGKSILIDALGLLMGNRGSADWVRYGESKAEIEGLFSVEESSVVLNKLTELGINCEEGMLVIRRELNSQGKSISRINGQLVTISTLREIGDYLINFHSQHDHHQLLQTYRHLYWLDAYGGDEIASLLEEYKSQYQKYSRMRREFENLRRNEQHIAQRLDLLKYQITEIEEAGLDVSEENNLLDERNRLAHSESIKKNVHGAYDSLTGEHKTLDWLGLAMGHLEEITALDPFLKEKFEQIEGAFYLIEEVAREINAYKENIEHDDSRLVWLEDRIHLINGLKRKYGDSIMAILEYAAGIEDELEKLENRDQFLHELTEELLHLKQDLLVEAKELSAIRTHIGEKLAQVVVAELKDLHLNDAQFKVHIEDLGDELSDNSLDLPGGEMGMNEVEFQISTNPGEPLKPLVKVASGGELSRIALTLRTVLARLDQVEVLVFDEVDTGVSGAVSQSIGEKLYRISREHQVLAITHHPQVASLADTHYLVSKDVHQDRTSTQIKMLNEEEQKYELARMIGGAEVSASAELHAAEMIRLGKQFKHTLAKT